MHHGPDLAPGRDARAQPRVPLDGARHHDLGRVHPPRDPHAAPGALGALGPKVDNLSLPPFRTRASTLAFFALWAERIWARRSYGVPALLPLSRSPRRRGPQDRHAVDQGRPGQATARGSATPQVQAAFGAGAPGALQLVGPGGRRGAHDRRQGRPRHRRRACPRRRLPDGRYALSGDPRHNPPIPRSAHDRPPAHRAPSRRARRRRRSREPRPRARSRTRRRS